MRRLLTLAVLACCGTMILGPLAAAERVALLIGNARYSATTPLANPPNDVELLRKSFTDAGFDKIEVALDLDRAGMVAALRKFEEDSAGADIAVLYYSGHGMELSGENYLIPTDAKLARDRDLADEAVPLARAMQAVDGAAKLKLVILDACRNNPFAPKMALSRGTRSVSRGLVRVEPDIPNILVAFAASQGNVALDGDGANSPYAAALARHLVEPGVDVRLALGKVRDDVLAATGSQQTPFFNGSLGGDTITLNVAPATSAPVTQGVTPPDLSEAARLWETMQASADMAELEAFRARFQGTPYAGLAARRLKQLQADAAQKLALVVSPGTIAKTAPVPITECDRLAAVEGDPDAVAASPPEDVLLADAALTACEQAMRDYPTERRFANQYGVVLYTMKKYDQAIEYLRKAEKLGSLDAGASLGIMMKEGIGMEKDLPGAVRQFTRVADAGGSTAMTDLATLYADGDGVEKDESKAVDLYRKAMAMGNAAATNLLGRMYEDGRGTAKDPAEAARLYERAGSFGNAEALFNLGKLYEEGDGVARDYDKARQLYEKAITRNSTDAMTALAYLYEHGLGIDKDSGKALSLYRQAADKSDATAMNNLAMMYEQGNGVAKDLKVAATYLGKASDLGESTATYNLAVYYFEGRGVKKDPAKALELFRTLADAGDADATYQIGFAYSEGRGVALDQAESARWLIRSLEARSGAAVTELTGNLANWEQPIRLALQKDLRKRGLYAGPLDGAASPRLVAAIRKLGTAPAP